MIRKIGKVKRKTYYWGNRIICYSLRSRNLNPKETIKEGSIHRHLWVERTRRTLVPWETRSSKSCRRCLCSLMLTRANWTSPMTGSDLRFPFRDRAKHAITSNRAMMSRCRTFSKPLSCSCIRKSTSWRRKRDRWKLNSRFSIRDSKCSTRITDNNFNVVVKHWEKTTNLNWVMHSTWKSIGNRKQLY